MTISRGLGRARRAADDHPRRAKQRDRSCPVKGLLAASLLLLGAGAAGAAEAAPKDKGRAVVQGLSAVSAPNARLAALVNAQGVVLRGKGVAFVAHDGTGSYCVVPSPSISLDLNTFVASVNADFTLNVGEVHLAEYGSSFCTATSPSGASRKGIRVITHSGDSAPIQRRDLAFAIIVP